MFPEVTMKFSFFKLIYGIAFICSTPCFAESNCFCMYISKDMGVPLMNLPTVVLNHSDSLSSSVLKEFPLGSDSIPIKEEKLKQCQALLVKLQALQVCSP
jgi:hypothetical protein